MELSIQGPPKHFTKFISKLFQVFDWIDLLSQISFLDLNLKLILICLQNKNSSTEVTRAIEEKEKEEDWYANECCIWF